MAPVNCGGRGFLSTGANFTVKPLRIRTASTEQFHETALLLGYLIFGFFHKGCRSAEQATIFLLRSNDDGQGHIEKLSILTFIE